jgi:glycosyltransferase involved in cell wall biosynthesis
VTVHVAPAAPLLLHVFPSFGIGGVPIRIAGILNHFGRGFRHGIVALDGDEACRRRLSPGLAVTMHKVAAEKGHPFGTLKRYRAALATIRPDLLLTYNWGAIEWGMANWLLPICPHVHLESGFGPEEAHRQARRRVLARRLVLKRCKALVVPSLELVRLAREVWRVDPAIVRHIPNGVDCARFAAPAAGVSPGFVKRPGEKIVGTVAPLRPEKNLKRLIDAFAAARTSGPARLVIVGDGFERKALEGRARERGIAERVVFTGNMEAPENVLAAFDIFALSSDTEQMPNSLLQAMAAGRAVAAVDVGDVKHLVAPGNRDFVVPADTPALTRAIETLLADDRRRADLGEDNRAHVRARYDQRRMFAAYGELFRSLLPTRPGMPLATDASFITDNHSG